MRVTRLSLVNVGRHRSLDMEFGPGIIGFTGVNGSGKSTILDAMCYAVTGDSRQPGTVSDNVTWGQSSGKILLEFTHGDSQFTIERKIGRSSGVSLRTPEGVLTRVGEVKEYLERLLCTTTQALLDNIFVPQKHIEDIFTATRSARLHEIQRTVGLGRAAAAYDALGNELSSIQVTIGLEEQLLSATGGLENARTEELVLVDRLSTLDNEMKLLEPAREIVHKVEEARRVSAALRAAESEIAAALQAQKDEEACRERAASEVARIQATLDGSRVQADSARKSILQYETSLREYQRAAAAVKSLRDLEQQLQSLGEPPSAERIQTLTALRDERADRIRDLKAKLSGETPRPLLAEESALIEQLQTLTSEKRTVREAPPSEEEHKAKARLSRLKEDLRVFASGKCPTCGTAAHCEACGHTLWQFDPDEHTRERDELERWLAQCETTRKAEFVQRQAELDTAIAAARRRQADFEKAARSAMEKALRDRSAQLEAVTQELAALTKHERRYRELHIRVESARSQTPCVGEEPEPVDLPALRALVEVFDGATRQLTKLETDLRVSEQRTADAAARLARARAARDNLGDVTVNISEQEEADARRQLSVLLARASARRELLEQLTACEVRREQYETMLQRLQQQRLEEGKKREWAKLCRRTRDVLHTSALPTLIMQEYARRLNERIAHFQRMWESPFSLKLNDSLEFEAEVEAGYPVPAARLSGGQTIVGALSFRLAMADTFARQVGLLVLDEPTNHLDQKNIEHLQRLLIRLKELAGATGRQVFIVTHVEALVGFFDQAFTIQQEVA